MKNKLEGFFAAQSVAVIGASRKKGKVGNVIFSNMLKWHGRVFPVNPKARKILGRKCFPDVLAINENIELAIIATPSLAVPGVVEQCGKKGVKNVVIISSGFREVGNVGLEKKVERILNKYKMNAIGPNCLGIFDAYKKIDTMFLPAERMKRPLPGKIAFISQSGALGSAVLDLAAIESLGISKFISYGNAIDIDETDLLEFLNHDNETKVVCMYIEGIKDGRRLLKAAKKMSKPVIAIKGGISEEGNRAVFSHTGALAGTPEAYFAAFKQAGFVAAHNLGDLFAYAKVFGRLGRLVGNKVQIITNGGGFGILAADMISCGNMALAKFSKSTSIRLKKLGVAIKNPLDLGGDATDKMFELAVNASAADKSIDAIIAIVLSQTPLISRSKIEKIIAQASKKKPIIVVTMGSDYAMKLKNALAKKNIAVFDFPHEAVMALDAYYLFHQKNQG